MMTVNPSKSPKHVAVTGAAGQISYSLLFRVAAGNLLGPDQPVVLHLLEIEPALKALDGVAMELDDCAFPLLADMVLTADPKEAFDGVSWAILVGAVPRKAGMERKDLLEVNGGIFKPQGQAIAAGAAEDVRIVVVGNPCNTNCSIARSHARDIPDERWFSMMRLDQNRSKIQMAKKASVPLSEVTRMAVWGNHSATQFPDFENALISGRPAVDAVGNREWFEGEFLTTIQQRGAKIIEARGSSSAASAANAIIDSVRSMVDPTPDGDLVSLATVSHGEYGVPEGLVFGFPMRSDGSKVEVVEGIAHSDFAMARIAATTKELEEERAAVVSLGLFG